MQGLANSRACRRSRVRWRSRPRRSRTSRPWCLRLRRDGWIIDGFGGAAVAWERFAAADTLIYVDLPLLTHYIWVTKRLIKGLFANPKGWPEDSPLWSSTLNSYRVIPLCHRDLTPKYRALVVEAAASKRVHHLRSSAQIRSFLKRMRKAHGAA